MNFLNKLFIEVIKPLNIRIPIIPLDEMPKIKSTGVIFPVKRYLGKEEIIRQMESLGVNNE